MQFNFFLRNHHTSGVASLEDIIRPIAAGLIEGGHEVQFEYVHLMPRPYINILFEYFPDMRLVEEIRAAKEAMGDSLILGLVGTEDLSDTISMGQKGSQTRLDNLKQIYSLFDFAWAIVPPDDYNHVLDGRMTCHFLRFGHCPSLENPPARHPSIDVMLYGKLNRYRSVAVHRLLAAKANVQATFGDMPEYLRYNMIQRSKLVLDMRRGEVVRYISCSRLCAALHNGSLVVAEDFDHSEAGFLYRYTVAAPYDTIAERALDLLHGGDEQRQAEARRLSRLFAEETSMRANLDALIPLIPI